MGRLKAGKWQILSTGRTGRERGISPSRSLYRGKQNKRVVGDSWASFFCTALHFCQQRRNVSTKAVLGLAGNLCLTELFLATRNDFLRLVFIHLRGAQKKSAGRILLFLAAFGFFERQAVNVLLLSLRRSFATLRVRFLLQGYISLSPGDRASRRPSPTRLKPSINSARTDIGGRI